MRILAVDIVNLFRIQWEAAQGKEMSQAFERTVANVHAARDGYDRTLLAVDTGPSIRKVAAPEYKANRTDPGEAYREQLRMTVERLRKDGCIVLHAPQLGDFGDPSRPAYAEADDVLGWVAARYRETVAKVSEEDRAGWWLRILSGDSDMEQLIDDEAGVDVQKPKSMGGGVWTVDTVIERRGVTPTLVRDLKALAGDTTDNYKPFSGDPIEGSDPPRRKPGIGDESAKKLIALYGGALQVFSAEARARWATDLTPAHRALLEKHGIEAAAKGLSLATLRTDLPLDFAAVLAEPKVETIAEPKAYDSAEYKSAPGAVYEEAPPVAPAKALALVRHEVTLDPSRPDWALSLQPQNAEEAWHMSTHFYDSRLFQRFPSASAIWTVILLGREYGLSALTSLQSIHMIDGKPEMSADTIAALVHRSGKAKRFAPVVLEPERVVYEAQRYDDPEPLRIEFTKAHAVARGLWGKGNWSKMQEVMLEHRCATKAARLKFPDVVRNLYGTGEVREMREVEAELA